MRALVVAHMITALVATAHSMAVRIVNMSHVPRAVISRDIPIWEQAANDDLAPAWNTPTITIRPGTARRPPTGFTIWLLPGRPAAGALGWHDSEGIHLYADAIRSQGHGISGALTHELFETLVDPNQNAAVSHDPGLWLVEVCDPTPKNWRLDGIRIADFVTPAWFGLAAGAPYDYAQVIGAPYEILPGGSAIAWNGTSFETIWG